jgi:hypothetical protein
MNHEWNTDFSKPVRADIFVVSHSSTDKAPLGVASSGGQTEDAAPTELKIILVLGSTNMPRLTALGRAWRRQILLLVSAVRVC